MAGDIERKYRKVEQYKCIECGKVHDHPSLAESCWYRDKMEDALEEAANHIKLSRGQMLEEIERMVEEGEFDDERFK